MTVARSRYRPPVDIGRGTSEHAAQLTHVRTRHSISGDGGRVRRTRARGRSRSSPPSPASRSAGRTDGEALRDAKQLTRLTALSAVEPDLTDRVADAATGRAGPARSRGAHARPALAGRAREALDARRPDRLLGRARALIGRRFALDAGRAARGADRRASPPTSATPARPENVFERGLGKLLEVYLPVRTPDGQPLLYEEYLRYGAVADSSRRQWLALVPAFGGALLVLALAQLPLAWWLARRLQQREQEREALLIRLVESSDRERRRLAQAAARRAGAGARRAWPGAWSAAARQAAPPLRGELAEAAADARATRCASCARCWSSLHPPNLAPRRPPGRADATPPLRCAKPASTCSSTCADVDLAARRRGARLPRRRGGAAQRRSGTPGATHVAVDVSPRRRARALCACATTARGFEPGDELAGPAGRTGIAGSRCSSDLAADAGGRLTVESAPGRGTRSSWTRRPVIRVLVVDDHPLARAGLEHLLGALDDIARRRRGRERRRGRPPGRRARARRRADGPRDARHGRHRGHARSCAPASPAAAVVVLTSFSDRERILAALDAGAVGYLLKDAEPDELARAIRAAAARRGAAGPARRRASCSPSAARAPARQLTDARAARCWRCSPRACRTS